MAITEKRETKFKDIEIGSIPAEWEVKPIYEFATWINGLAFKNIDFSDTGTPVIKIAELKNGLTQQTRYTKQEFKPEYKLLKKDILFSWSGSPETSIDCFWYPLDSGWLNQHIFKVIPDKDLDENFLFYILKFLKPIFIETAKNKQTTGLGHVTVGDLKRIIAPKPSLSEQKSIAEILSSLDEKIELNRRMNKTLEEMGKALFKRWFVDFEFPNEDGKPYKSSGGKMVDSELGEIPEGWEVKPLENFVEIFDSKRVPLSSREREACQGTYPYYGATQAMDYVNDYLFDGIYLLVAEDGTVKTSDSKPVTQYVWGKFWVNNHAHIIQGTNGYSTEAIKIFLDNINIDCYITGAVQPKINQSALRSIPVISPCKKYLEQYNSMVLFLFDQLRLLTNEINSLEKIKSSLLPKLISGKIRVEGELCKA
jgi:type I restriction enzyme S subunit